MPLTRFVILLGSVIGAAALTVGLGVWISPSATLPWVAVPIALLAYLGLRLLSRCQ